VAQPTRGPVGLGAAGWRRSADYDRRSLRELAPKRVTLGNAAAEYPGPDGPVASAIAAHRTQVRGLFDELLAGFPAARRAALTDQLVLLYDGTMVAGQLDQGPRAARRAQAVARHLLEQPHPRPR
jgi:hypothetical protein